MNMTKRIAVWIFVWCMLLGALPAQAQEVSLSLDEALALGMRQNQSVKLSLDEVLRARAALGEASSERLPSVNAAGSLTHTMGLYDKDVRSIKTDIGVSQVLFAGGRIINTISFAEQGVVIAQAVLEGAKLEAALQIRKAFFACLLAEKLEAVNKHILSNAQAHFAAVKARYDAGQASRSDLLRVEQSLASVQQAYEASRNQRIQAQAFLQTVLALQPGVLIVPKGELSYQPQEVAFDEALLAAMRSRPEIRRYEALEKQAKASVGIAKSGSRPTVSAAWDYYSSSTPALATSSARAWNDHQIAGITVSWPVFDGWAAKRRVEQALSEVSQAQTLREKAALDIALDVKTAYLGLRDAVEAIKASEAEVALYRDAQQVSSRRFQAGEMSVLEADDAQLRFEIAVFNGDQALYEYSVAKAAFEKATGGLR
jgi:outer membrane protein